MAAECSEGVSRQASEVTAFNFKLLADTYMQRIAAQSQFPSPWEQLALRMANNSATFDHFVNMTTANAGQTGDTQGQQTNSAVRTGAADNLAAGAAPTNRVTDTAGNAVAAGVAESVQTNVTSQVSALTEQITALGGTITTALQTVSTSNASIAASMAEMAAALTALAPKATA
jgi:hypothetical protein